MSMTRPLKSGFTSMMIKDVPAYANKFFYSLGFLSMTCFLVLVITGTIMAIFGPDWWLTDPTGRYLRSIHLWATQAFVLFVILHGIIVFSTSGFKKPRRLTWVIGLLMFLFVLSEAEFGYVLRDDFSSQWRALQGADFYNGTGLGYWINNINYRQVFGLHIIVIPLVIIGLLFLHYLRIRMLGIAKPYRKDVDVPTVRANHSILFIRGTVLVALMLALASVFPSPLIKPDTIQSVARNDSKLVAQTLVSEFTHDSDTATYMDSINPYNFDTREIFVSAPYSQYVALTHSPDLLKKYGSEPSAVQAAQLKQTQDYFENTYPAKPNPKNPLEGVIISLTNMADTGLYQSSLNSANPNGDQSAYALRFLADTGVMEDQAQSLGITTDQYGMLHEEKGHVPPGAWWLAPIGLLNHTVLSNDDNGDRDGAIILGLFLLFLLAIPFIPFLNRVPDWLRLYKPFWRV